MKMLAQRAIEAEGKLSAAHVFRIAFLMSLPTKTTFEFLEYAGVLPLGTWERRIKGKVSAAEAFCVGRDRRFPSMGDELDDNSV
jgi:hypothetical protein